MSRKEEYRWYKSMGSARVCHKNGNTKAISDLSGMQAEDEGIICG